MTTAFLAHSFAKDDEPTVQNIRAFLESFALSIVTGERPSAEPISEKIKTRISDADIFCVLLTARHKGETPVSQSETSPWLPQELAFATGCRKPLLIFREEGLEVFSGLNSDHEYIEFNRRCFDAALIKAVPYILSAIKLAGGSTVDDTGADVIDEFEARRMAAKLQNRCNVFPTQSAEDQNAGFRRALIAFILVSVLGLVLGVAFYFWPLIVSPDMARNEVAQFNRYGSLSLNLERRNALQNKAFAAWIERTQILKQRYSTDQLPSKSEYEDFILQFTEFAEATFTPLQIKSFQGLESGAGGEMFGHPDGLSADFQQQFIQLALIEYWLKYYTELNLKSEEPIDPEKMSV